jgi:subtilase family serine protease
MSTPSHPARGDRRPSALWRPLVAVALVVAVTVPTIGGFGSPASAATPVDFGVVGEEALEEWAGSALEVTGPTDPATVLHLYLGLVSDRAALEARALSASDPTSARYASWTSVVEEGRRSNATTSTIDQVVAWFADRGATVAVDPTRSYVEGDVPVSVAAEAFASTYVDMALTEDPTALTISTPAEAPSQLAPGLEGLVDRVYGAVLFDETSADPDADVTHAPDGVALPQAIVPAAGGDPVRTGTFSGCAEAGAVTFDGLPSGLAPGQLRAAYGLEDLFDAGWQGQGTHVAVVDSNDYLPSDLQGYRECFGLADATPVSRHLEGDVTFDDGDGSEETTLDLALISAFAPRLDRLDWFGTATTDSDFEVGRFMFDMLVAPLDPALTGGEAPDLVSVSFGFCEAYLVRQDPGASPIADLLDQVLATAAAGGTTFVVASGDDGSSGCYRFIEGAEQTAAAVEWPAASPWVLAVGGTNIALDDANQLTTSGVWNDRLYGQTTGQIGGGGGGVSTLFTRSPWQQSSGVPGGSARAVPDVAAFADSFPGHLLRFSGEWGTVGGTSASTPLTAGSLAVLSGALTAHGQPPLGYVPPLLYAVGDLGDTGSIYDVTIGSNDTNDIGVYPAASGFDLATGWGSLMYHRLAGTLAPPTVPAGGVALSVGPGGDPLSLEWVATPALAAGTVLEYRWDVDGDGVADHVTTNDRLSVDYASPGAVMGSVTVRTSLGREATFSATGMVGASGAGGVAPNFTW